MTKDEHIRDLQMALDRGGQNIAIRAENAREILELLRQPIFPAKLDTELNKMITHVRAHSNYSSNQELHAVILKHLTPAPPKMFVFYTSRLTDYDGTTPIMFRHKTKDGAEDNRKAAMALKDSYRDTTEVFEVDRPSDEIWLGV